MKKVFLLFLLLSFTQTLVAQTDIYNVLYKEGNTFIAKKDYITAFIRFDKAKDKAINNEQKSKAQKKIEYCHAKIRQQQDELKKALENAEEKGKEAEKQRQLAEQEKENAKKQEQLALESLQLAKEEKQKVTKALLYAEEMQAKVETAMFDKAVKEQFKEWRGYSNYGGFSWYDITEILNKVTELDLHNNALLRIPKEVLECPNLTHINLLENPNINWKETESTLKNLDTKVGLYVSIRDLRDINKEYWHLVTGIDLIEKKVDSIPQNILQQKQLEYLELNNQLTSLPKEIGNLTSLTELDLSSNQLTSLPKDIGNLTSLIKLNLRINQLTSLPKEIGELANLTELDLSINQLTSLPKEIGSLNSLTRLYLTSNQLTSLPKEIGNLTSLTKLYFNFNQLTSLPKEIGNLINLSSNFWFSMGKNFLDKKYFKEAYNTSKKLTILEPTNYSRYFNLSWYSLFANKPQEAIKAAKKTLELEPEEVSVKTNLVLGYILNNEYKKAEKIYIEWKDKHFPNDERLAKEVFLKDIADLEKAGITHPDFEKVRALLSE